MYEILWLQPALDELTTAWVDADSNTRQRITRASHELELLLKEDPFGISESRDEVARITFFAPLAILFAVDIEESRVWILHAWTYRTGKR